MLSAMLVCVAVSLLTAVTLGAMFQSLRNLPAALRRNVVAGGATAAFLLSELTRDRTVDARALELGDIVLSFWCMVAVLLLARASTAARN